MSASSKLLTGQIIGFLVGIFTASGHLTPMDASSLTQTFTDLIGGVIAVISLYTFFEHHSVMAQNEPTTTEVTIPLAQTPQV